MNESQKRSVERLKKAIENHVAKPTKLTAGVVQRSYANLLANTLDASVLNKSEVTALQEVMETPQPL